MADFKKAIGHIVQGNVDVALKLIIDQIERLLDPINLCDRDTDDAQACQNNDRT